MKNFRLFFKEDDNNNKAGNRKGKDGFVHTAMFSDFFSEAKDNIFFTNAMYAQFLEEVIATVNIYDPREKISLDIYENEASDEDKRELALIGFRSYTNSLIQKKHAEFMDQLLQVSFFVVIGVVIIVLIYVIGMKQNWLFFLLQNIGAVLIWQFVGYWAFQYAGIKREMEQLKQIANIKYNFKKWE